MIVIFDIDGTIADIGHRLHHIQQKPKNWKAFDTASDLDTVIEPTRKIYNAFVQEGHKILFVTGRNERMREQTEGWLNLNGFNSYDALYMRGKTDFRQDDIVKREVLGRIVERYGEKPAMVFEDRKRVIRMWRDAGIFTIDVNQYEEEF